MSTTTPKKPAPEIYAPGDQVAVWTTHFGNSEIVGIYPVDFITAREAILKTYAHGRIPLQKSQYDRRVGDTYSAIRTFKPAEQADFDAMALKTERAKAASLIQDLRNIVLTELDIKAITALSSALENAIKSIDL